MFSIVKEEPTAPIKLKTINDIAQIKEEDTQFSYINFDELSQLLRPWYSKNSLYHIVNKKGFPKYKIGKKLFFKVPEIEDWIESQLDDKP